MKVPFTVTAGPYAGAYNIDTDDLTGTETNRFRQAVGVTIQQGLDGNHIDLDVFCGLVWIVRTRGGNRGLPFQAVADNITKGQIDIVPEEVEAQNAPPPDESDPTSGGAA